jgi:hypothetical protein
MSSKFAMKTFAVITLIGGLGVASWAGDIEGKVTGMKGHSVVYVDAIAGKTFPLPKSIRSWIKKGLVFAPHIMAVQQGTTVDFPEQRHRRSTTFSGLRSVATRKPDTILAPGPRVKSVLYLR